MKFHTLAILFALLVLLNPAIAAESPGPKITISEITFEFPQVREGEKLAHDFTVINEGDQTLVIDKVATSCGCTVANFDRRIEPGQKGTVSLALDTANMHGNFRKTATVYSNAVNSNRMMLTLTGNVKPYFLVKPRASIFMSVLPGETTQKILDVQALEGEELKLLGGKTGLEDVIKFEIKEVQPNKEYQVIVENKANKIGRYGGYLELFTNNENKPIIKVRVSVNVQGEVLASPPSIIFGNVTPEKLPETTFRRKLFLRRQGQKELQLAGAKYDEKKYDVQVKELQKNKVYEVMVTLRPEGFKKGSYDDMLQFKTNVETQPIVEIPVKVTIQ